MRRKVRLTAGESARTIVARCVLRTGVDAETGEPLTASVLVERVGWCADLVADMAAGLLAEHWNAADVKVLATGEDAGGRKLPTNAWMALRRLDWGTAPREGCRVNDRIVRMAQEQAGRILRSATWRGELTGAVIATWPADPARRTGQEWDAMRAAAPHGRHLPSSVIKARTRQIAAFIRQNGRMPADVFEVENAPRAARMLLLSACDGQQATIERADVPGRALLRLKLPSRPDPRSQRDWTWVTCPITLPPTIPAGAVLHLPTLRPHQGRVLVDLSATYAVPKSARSGYTVALGVDWGLNTLLSAGAVRLNENGRITVLGAGGMFRAAGVLSKQHRLRRLSEFLHAKADRYQRLTAGDEKQHGLAAKHAILSEEISRVCARRSKLNDALAWAAARWAVDQAVAAGASVVYVEDLRSLEARGMSRTMNTCLSQQVRGQIVDRMRHLAAEVGSCRRRPSQEHLQALPSVPHPAAAPQSPRPAHHPGLEMGHLPGLWLAGRPRSGCLAAHRSTWSHPPEQDRHRPHHRRHGHPHRRRHARSGLGHHTSCRADDPAGPIQNRTHPAQGNTSDAQATPDTLPAMPSGRAGQRPEGHAHTDRPRLPRAADRHQDVTTISTPTERRHRPRGAALGAGFHLHAHATPPRWEAISVPDTKSGSGSLR